MPRNKSVRLAPLSAPAQRASSQSYGSRSNGALRRRLIVLALVLLSLTLISVYFRESESGSLHDVQSVGATALEPFEIGVARLARPFQDAYGYMTGLIHAKAENDDLRAEAGALRRALVRQGSTAQEAADLRLKLNFVEESRYPESFEIVGARITSHTEAFQQYVVISAGTEDGVRRYDPVVTQAGLVGKVTLAYARQSRVSLLTNSLSAVSARVFETGAYGLVKPGPRDDALVLDRVPKEAQVRRGDLIVTAGRRYRREPSVFPADIEIGEVASVGQDDISQFKNVQVRPFVDFDSLDIVLVLTTK